MNYRKAIIALASMLALTACHDFAELNTNPYQPPYNPGSSATDVNPEGIDIDYKISKDDSITLQKNEANLGTLFRNMTNEGAYNDYQVTTNLTHDTYAGFMANTDMGFHYRSCTYVYYDDWSKNRWNHFYNDRSAAEYAQIIRICHFVNPEKYHNEYYVARIYYAFLISMQTDTYGDIPLQYYVKGALPPSQNVNYTKQADVYDAMFKLLDQALTNINPAKGLDFGSTSAGSNDRCYGNDLNKWLRFANTLRLRLALRISNVNPARAKEEAEKAIGNAYGLMKDNGDNMRTVPKFASLALGGEGGGGSENIHALIFNWGATMVMSKDMEVAYKNESNALDPRCKRLWWRPSPYEELKVAKESTKDFAGCPIGDISINGSDATKTYSPVRCNPLVQDDKNNLFDDYWFTYARELVWMSYAESRFMLAEAALRGWNAGGTVDDFYRQGIQASMDYYHISAADAQEYLDGLKNEQALTGGDKEAALKEIITQKWLAIFPNGNEGWAEFRRTDYPELLNIVENNSDGDVPEGKFIKRIKYPQSETFNPNRPVSNNQGTRVWWDVSDTNDDNGLRLKPNNFR
ncbi:MAG: SusD/RagB family nutrient-binding outer membrane lipoprotein [Mediterranea sp.]|nr:SusD/RagB family nutrient-binding outer membrane lipoprotein [Mediterranea sp.]